MATKLIAFANIKSGSGSWEEDFPVSSRETAETEIKEVIQNFNDTLKPGETERSFDSIVRFENVPVEEKDASEFEDEYDDFNDYDFDDRYDFETDDEFYD
jgi:hypothetical protein